MSVPIKPDEVNEAQRAIPAAVFDAFNMAIIREWDGKRATVNRSDVSSHIADLLGMCGTEVFERGYLDIADAYRDAGWKVDIKQTLKFDLYFTFSK